MTQLTPELKQYLSGFDQRLLTTPEGRRVLTKHRPGLFALLYLRHHLQDAEGLVSFSEVHWDWCTQAEEWIRPTVELRNWRRAFVAPRSMGKSTWWFLILPLWAAAHGHKKFAIAFADSASQSTQHLATFRKELETNELLRRDYEKLCNPARKLNGVTEADARDMYKASSGFTFIAKGVDSASLGAKQGAARPDLLVFDDIEGAPGTYSVGQAASRLSTITEGLFPLNELAAVVMVGTTTIPGGIMHQLVQSQTSTEVPASWIVDERVVARYYDPLPANEDGSRRSLWPEKWSLEFLESIEHTHSFAKNYRNDPMAADSVYWSRDDFKYVEAEQLTHVMLSIDPAVTAKSTSDETGLAVVGYSNVTGKITVLHCEGVRLTPGPLRVKVTSMLALFPQVGLVYVETNQGGDYVTEALKGLPVNVKEVKQSVKKEVRAADALVQYQRGMVYHDHALPRLEQQMVAFPNAPHDDLVDSVATGVNYFTALRGTQKRSSGAVRAGSYL